MAGRWETLKQLRGIRVHSFLEDDYPETPAKYEQPWVDLPSNGLSPEQRQAYGDLNQRLHQAIEAVFIAHFSDTEVPQDLADDGCGSGTPFTYQVWDWYAPSYECHVVVYEPYLSAKLLQTLQQLLVGDHKNWCIVVNTTQTLNFETSNELPVFADDIFLPLEALDDLDISVGDLP